MNLIALSALLAEPGSKGSKYISFVPESFPTSRLDVLLNSGIDYFQRNTVFCCSTKGFGMLATQEKLNFPNFPFP